MKNRIIKELLEGAALAAVVTSMLFGAGKINAASAGKKLPQEYAQLCIEAGEKYQICPELLEAVIERESGGNPDAVGLAGEVGLMQVYPAYHRERMSRLGIASLYDPKGNILAGTDYLAELLAEYGDAGTALMAYNGVKDARERGERGELTDYAKGILERARELELQHGK